MDDLLNKLTASQRWNLLVHAAKRGIGDAGYKLERVPGRGLSNVWKIAKPGKTSTASIRTTRDRYIAFPPLEGGKKWKTLDDVDVVVVAAVDSQKSPQNVEVYILPADEVRKRFDASYAARAKAGLVMRDNFGMWLALDEDTRDTPARIGSGIAKQYKRVAKYAITDLLASSATAYAGSDAELDVESRGEVSPRSIAEVMAWARERVAEIAGVRVEAVKLDLKVEC